MYNLFVTAQSGAWKGSAYEYERGRSVREYTDDAIQEKFRNFGKDDIQGLVALPCLFVYEGATEASTVGWLTSIKPRQHAVRVEFELDKSLPKISSRKLAALATELDITAWELNRTHWAVKDINLPRVLRAARILTERKIQELGAESRFVRLAVSAPINELHVKPSVFRLPEGKIEEDLVSMMVPFNASFEKVSATIKAACKDSQLRCQRADDIWEQAEVIQDIFSLIYRSRIVVCDFSGRNPNVLYEAGIAHTLGRPVIPIVQNLDDIPFDLRHLRCIRYHDNGEGRERLRADISSRLRAITA